MHKSLEAKFTLQFVSLAQTRERKVGTSTERCYVYMLEESEAMLLSFIANWSGEDEFTHQISSMASLHFDDEVILHRTGVYQATQAKKIKAQGEIHFN